MVGIIKHTLASGKSIVSEADSRRSGARYRFGGSPESRGASNSGRHLASITGQGDEVCRYMIIRRRVRQWT